MRIAVEEPVEIKRAEIEAIEKVCHAFTNGGRRIILEPLIKGLPVHQRRSEHPLSGKLMMHLGNDDPRVSAETCTIRLLILGLLAVVTFVHEALLELLHDPRGVDAEEKH